MIMRSGYFVKFFALAILLSSSLSLAAEKVIPIYQIGDASTGGDAAGSFIQVPLSHQVYRYSMLLPDLQNLLVLDAEKNPLPYGVVSLKPSQVNEPVISDDLLFFPIAVDASADMLRKLHSGKLQVESGSVQLTTTDKILNNSTPEFYLLDLSKLNHAVTGLRLEWNAQTGSQYLELELEATRDLQEWISLGRSTLVQIEQPQQSLKKNKIDLNIAKNTYQFLRLRVIRGADNFQLKKVTAEQKAVPAAVIPDTKERWSLAGELAEEQTQVELNTGHHRPVNVSAWEFTRTESTPIETLAIDFGEEAYSSSGKIFSRGTPNQNWELQYQGVFFSAQIGSQWQSSGPVSVTSKNAKYWRIELKESARDKVRPKLVFAWQPMALQIITNNKPPYYLAVSEAGSSNPSRQVFNQLVMMSSPIWQPASLIALNLDPDTVMSAPGKIDWRQYMFWAVLLLAVLVLLLFALKLFKQINIDVEKK